MLDREFDSLIIEDFLFDSVVHENTGIIWLCKTCISISADK